MSESDPPVFRMLPGDGFEEEVAPDGPSRSLSRRSKFALIALASALALGGLAVQLQRSQPRPSGDPAPPPVASSAASPHWPVGLDNCGNPVPQPIVEQSLSASKTRASVLVGGLSLILADLDSGTFSPVPHVNLPTGASFVDGTVFASNPFLEIADCRSGARIVQLDAGGRLRTVLTDPVGGTLLADGTGGTWSASFSGGGTTIGESKLQVTMQRLDHPVTIPLGALMYPLAMNGHLVYVRLETPGAPDRLQTYDLATRRTVRDLGPISSVSVTGGRIIWLPHSCPGAGSCQLNTLDPSSAVSSTWQLPLPANFRLDNASLSLDGTLLAVQVAPDAGSARRSSGDQAVPTVVVVLDLTTKTLTAVPHLSVPPGARIDYTFSTDSTRLILAIAAGTNTDFYTWQPGQAAPMISPMRLPGPPPTYLEPAGTT